MSSDDHQQLSIEPTQCDINPDSIESMCSSETPSQRNHMSTNQCDRNSFDELDTKSNTLSIDECDSIGLKWR